MEDKKYLDQKGLKEYDELIKRYINRELDEITLSQNQDMTIVEWPPVQQNGN